MNKLQAEAMDRNNECAPMSPEFSVPDNLSGAAVRGEAVAGSEEQLLARIYDAIGHAESNDHRLEARFGQMKGVPAVRVDDLRAHIDGWKSDGGAAKVSARAADAPSEPPTEILAKVMTRDDFNCSTELGYAQFLAWVIWLKSYRAVSPDFSIMDNLKGVLSQIDNMVCGLSRAADAPSEPSELAMRAVLLNAKAVIQRWDSPLWRQEVHTAEWINQLRKSVELAESHAADALDSQPTEVREIGDEYNPDTNYNNYIKNVDSRASAAPVASCMTVINTCSTVTGCDWDSVPPGTYHVYPAPQQEGSEAGNG